MLTEEQIRKAPKEDYMNPAQLEFFKEHLLKLKKETMLHIEEVKQNLSKPIEEPDELDRAQIDEAVSQPALRQSRPEAARVDLPIEDRRPLASASLWSLRSARKLCRGTQPPHDPSHRNRSVARRAQSRVSSGELQ